MDTLGTAPSKPHIIGAASSGSERRLHMPKVAVILTNLELQAVALVRSARDEHGATWTPPQGTYDAGSLKESARRVVAAECGISQLRFVDELFNQKGPDDRDEKKYYLWVHCTTLERSLSPHHPSITAAQWAFSQGQFSGLMSSASQSKYRMAVRAVRQICESDGAHRLEWQLD